MYECCNSSPQIRMLEAKKNFHNVILTSSGRDNSFGILVHPVLHWKLATPLIQILSCIIRSTALLCFKWSCLRYFEDGTATWIQYNIFKLQFLARYDSTTLPNPCWHRGKSFDLHFDYVRAGNEIETDISWQHCILHMHRFWTRNFCTNAVI